MMDSPCIVGFGQSCHNRVGPTSSLGSIWASTHGGGVCRSIPCNLANRVPARMHHLPSGLPAPAWLFNPHKGAACNRSQEFGRSVHAVTIRSISTDVLMIGFIIW